MIYALIFGDTRRCQHCDRWVVSSDDTPGGWTHGDPAGLAHRWQGLRCPAGLTSALPGPRLPWWKRIRGNWG